LGAVDMGSHPRFLRQARRLAIGSLVASLGCGETSRNVDADAAAGSPTSVGGSSSQVVPPQGGALAAGGSATGDVKVGHCVFEDPNVA
jgi:hypothetical protein